MSTTFISMSLEAMRDDLMEYINFGPLDMLDEFPDEEIADCVLAIASKLMNSKVVDHPLTSCGGIKNYKIKVNNIHGGFVSVSDEDTGDTGVSRTMYYPFFKDDEDGYFAGLTSLASMINEAWYQCKITKAMDTKKCKYCGETSPLAEWHLTMDFNGKWKCECPRCKKISYGLY